MDNTAGGSTGAMALQALKNDPEIVKLLVRVGKKYPEEEATALVHGVIELTLSTSESI